MKYFIRRELNEYGPYTLADIQRYVVQGNILLTDLTRSEGMDEWVPVSQVIGNIPLAPPAVPAGQGTGTVYAGGTVYNGPSAGYGVAPAMAPLVGVDPPGLHWGWVLALGILTRWLFSIIWGFVQASWVQKVSNSAKSIYLLAGYVLVSISAGIILGINKFQGHTDTWITIAALLLLLGAFVLYVMAAFSMRDAIENYYNTVEPINLDLSGVMTFFFNFIYFQYHFTRIKKWKKTGILTPQ